MTASSRSGAVPVQWRAVGASSPAPGGLGFGAPAALCRLVANSNAAQDLIVIGIQDQSEREAARRAIREAIAAELMALSGLPPRRIALHTPEGQVPYALLDTPAGQRRAWIAISHDGALSLAAISLHGPVGIDVTQVMDIPDWEPVARDYLGPDAAAALAALPAAGRAEAFASAWSEREARLKYLGRELIEWSEEGDRALAACRCLPLALPEAYTGVLALPPDPA
jgi:4'-phosphopantetheinyl transferase